MKEWIVQHHFGEDRVDFHFDKNTISAPRKASAISALLSSAAFLRRRFMVHHKTARNTAYMVDFIFIFRASAL